MNRSAALLALFAACAVHAQTAPLYMDETGNGAIMTTFANTSDFAFEDAFEWSSPSVLVDLAVTGQEGTGSCSGRGCGSPPVYKTFFSTAPTLIVATYANDPNGACYALAQGSYQRVGCDVNGNPAFRGQPAVDVNGNPITWQAKTTAAGTIGWSMGTQTKGVFSAGAALPAADYVLSFSGTSCGGRGCQIPGDSYVYVRRATLN